MLNLEPIQSLVLKSIFQICFEAVSLNSLWLLNPRLGELHSNLKNQSKYLNILQLRFKAEIKIELIDNSN